MEGKNFSADTLSIEAIVSAFYDIVSGPPGAPRQWARDQWIHAPNAKILYPTEQGFQSLSLQEYHERGNRHERVGFFEEEIHRDTEQFGNIAHVWSTYRWRRAESGPWEGRGINSIQLYFESERWWVSSWTFFSESKSLPIPKVYLP